MIPASALVNVLPGVLSAGGNPLSLNAIFLTADTSVPIGTVQAFSSAADVADWFGADSIEAQMAAVYFGGFTNAQTLPSTLYFVQYNAAAVSGYLRSGSFEGVTVTQLQLLSGTLTLSIDGESDTSGAINLASATSFTNAAALIEAQLPYGAQCDYDAQLQRFVITSPTTGDDSSVSFATAGTLANGLKLTAATGAVLSPGADAATAAGLLNNVIEATQNWATFTTCFEPDTTGKLAFTAWVQTTNERYAYVAGDTDVTPTEGAAPASFGAQVVAAEDDGIFPIWGSTVTQALLKSAFVCGCAASIDFEQTQGRITFAFKGQAGLTADVTNQTVADNLSGNGYNFYAAYATANDQFINLQHGSTPGVWKWFDSYVNQIWLNNALQLAFMAYLAQVRSVPYNTVGYNALRAVALDPINAALNAGVIQPGVTLSNAQRAQINTAVGGPAAPVIEQTGYFLDIKPASPEARAQRTSPPMTLYYTDGGSIQQIELSSIEVQ